jgi:hypothetical protein
VGGSGAGEGSCCGPEAGVGCAWAGVEGWEQLLGSKQHQQVVRLGGSRPLLYVSVKWERQDRLLSPRS